MRKAELRFQIPFFCLFQFFLNLLRMNVETHNPLSVFYFSPKPVHSSLRRRYSSNAFSIISLL